MICPDNRPQGFGLVELLIGMAIGLILILGVMQIFIGAKRSVVVQQQSAAMQENARFALSRIARELRTVNAYGCLDLGRLPPATAATIPSDFATPIAHDGETLKIIAAVANAEQFSAETTRSASDYGARWLIATNCRDGGELRVGIDDVPVRPGDLLIPVRQVEYRLRNHALGARLNGAGNYETLIDGVSAFDVSFGLAATAAEPHVSGNYLAALDPTDFARIRSVRLSLQLSDRPQEPQAGAVREARYTRVTTLRNRMN